VSYPAYEELELPLLKLIYERGGRVYEMKASDTYDLLADYFNLSDLERKQTRDNLLNDGRNELVWNNRVQWARRKLNEYGYLSPSQRGLWKLSQEGVAKARTISTGKFLHVSYPDEVAASIFEGAKRTVQVNAFERSTEARQQCIDFYGYSCSVCNFNFLDHYGERGRHFIHVHHIVPLSSINQVYEVDPIADLRPVCPNCHAMLHRTTPPCSIEELKKIITKT
jgi:5-methylcytosine-specific restriction protein A